MTPGAGESRFHQVPILLGGKQTGERFTTLLVTSPPGGGPGPHYHDVQRRRELFYSRSRVVFGAAFPTGETPRHAIGAVE